jgi:hypothetical protein
LLASRRGQVVNCAVPVVVELGVIRWHENAVVFFLLSPAPYKTYVNE